MAEAQAGASKVFATLNPDKDATLDAKELGDRIDAAALKASDPDNDGTLDAKEYAKVVGPIGATSTFSSPGSSSDAQR